MANYKEMYDRSVEKQNMEVMNVNIHKWEAEGDMLIGRLLEYKIFDGSEHETKCMVYTFDTDNGKESCVLGAIGDKILATEANLKKVFAITFNGQIDTQKGRRCNDFSIVRIPEGK